MRTMRRTLMFSPIFWTSASRLASRSPAINTATSVSFFLNATSSTSLAKLMKLSSRATKSVSEFTSKIRPTVWSSEILISETPSAAVRPAFLAAFRPDDLRSSSIAASTLPSDSTKAFLHSIMPRPVRSRSSLTIAAVIAAMLGPLKISEFGRKACPEFVRAGFESQSKSSVALKPCSQALLCTLLCSRRCAWGFFANFNKLVCANVDRFQAGVSNRFHVNLDSTDGVIVTRDYVINTVRVAVGVNHANNRNTQLVGFFDSDTLVVNVYHEPVSYTHLRAHETDSYL